MASLQRDAIRRPGSLAVSRDSSPEPKPYFPFKAQSSVERRYAPWVPLLLGTCKVENVRDSKALRPHGIDFFLHAPTPHGLHRVAMEDKFDTHDKGNLALELVSVGRGSLRAGWIFTSRAAWLLTWFVHTGDLVVLPMDALRACLLPEPLADRGRVREGTRGATTARNKSYLSWSLLEQVDWLLTEFEDARAVDLRHELGGEFDCPSVVRTDAAREKLCTPEALIDLAASRPASSTPVPVSDGRLRQLMREMAPLNRQKNFHKNELAALPWLTA